MKGPSRLFVLLFEQSRGGMILILDGPRLPGQRDSLFIIFPLFPSSAVVSSASKQVENTFNWGDSQQQWASLPLTLLTVNKKTQSNCAHVHHWHLQQFSMCKFSSHIYLAATLTYYCCKNKEEINIRCPLSTRTVNECSNCHHKNRAFVFEISVKTKLPNP